VIVECCALVRSDQARRICPLLCWGHNVEIPAIIAGPLSLLIWRNLWKVRVIDIEIQPGGRDQCRKITED
jgi:hypothetical protein